MRMRKLLVPISVSFFLALLAGCLDRPRSERAAAPIPRAIAVRAAVEQAPPPTPLSAPVLGPALEEELRSGAAASRAAADKFKAWGLVHAFLGTQVSSGRIISPTEAVVLTKDNHVGITRDAGETWGFIHHDNGTVTSVAGRPGGPYVAVGRAGYVAISEDGGGWRALARRTNIDLTSVAVGDGDFVATGKKGVYIRFDNDGSGSDAGFLPDRFQAGAVTFRDGRFYALKKSKGYASAHGRVWMPVDSVPPTAGRGGVPTSRGICGLGKVSKKSRGVVCEVSGAGFGVGDNRAFVEKKGAIAFTSDQGVSWTFSGLPFSGLNAVVGPPAGPWYALGNKGALAVSTDGVAWRPIPLQTTANLRAGLVDGATVLIVGDKGTVVRSADGGSSWQVVPTGSKGKFAQIIETGGRYAIPAGRQSVESTDGGLTWVAVADPALLEMPAPGRPGNCEARLPAQGEVCKFGRQVLSPPDLPNVKSFEFVGETGLAMGDSGLVMFTTDGGRSWRSNYGYDMREIQTFAVRGERIVVVGKKSVVVSTDGGRSFSRAELPKKTGAIATALIAEDGTVYAAGKSGTIIASRGDLSLWVTLFTGAKNRTNYVQLFELAGILYASGQRGELYRSHDNGNLWWPIATGVGDAIQKMAAEGSTVLAVAVATRSGSNRLLRSDDAGKTFYIQRVVSAAGPVSDFGFAGGILRYDELQSDDFGATWTPGQENYWAGAVDVGDGSGLRLVRRARYKAKDRIFLVGTAAGDWTRIDSISTQGAWFRCEQATGCWMMNGGRVYRPL